MADTEGKEAEMQKENKLPQIKVSLYYNANCFPN